MRGYTAANQHHKENTGLPYKPFKLEKSGDFAEVRVLQSQDEWLSLFFHQVFGKLKRTRCSSEDSAKNPEICGLCAVEAPRKLVTFIPVRVRGDEEEDRVQLIEAGRDTLNEIVSQIEELPEGADITTYDFKVKRAGEKLDTKYKWHLQASTKRPLDEREAALPIPNVEEMIEVPDELTLVQRIKQYRQAEDVKPVESAKTGKSRF